jgi:hypothetical protein
VEDTHAESPGKRDGRRKVVSTHRQGVVGKEPAERAPEKLWKTVEAPESTDAAWLQWRERARRKSLSSPGN